MALVILYHAGVVTSSSRPAGVPSPWFFDGGFLGVEVFFVVSGFLITTLLLQERDDTGGVSLRQFWLRRFRRLMPALWVMILVTAIWAVFWGREHLAALRRDAIFGLTYTSNFQQLFDEVSYFEGLPSLLRHLWSLAVEEHFYLLFPPLLVWLVVRRNWGLRRMFWLVAVLALMAMVGLGLLWERPVERLGESGLVLDDARQNWAYLSSFTRMGGILVGVALAMYWSPWRRPGGASPWRRPGGASPWRRPGGASPWRRPGGASRSWLDVAGVAAVGGVVASSLLLSSTSWWLYRGGLSLVSVLSAVAIAAAVAPGCRLMRRVFGNRLVAGLGRRSYGLYLWHWPVFVGPLGGRSTWVRLVVGVPVTLVLSELCLRAVENPVRHGVIGAWVRRGRWVPVLGSVVAVGVVAAALFTVTPRDVMAGDNGIDPGDAIVLDDPAGEPADELADELTDELNGSGADPDDPSVGDPVVGDPVVSDPGAGPAATRAPTAPATAAGPPTSAPRLPRRVVVVGDSTAGAFAKLAPRKSADTFTFFDGSLSGCSVIDNGKAFSTVRFGRDFAACEGWQLSWGAAARLSAAEVALVIVGAWDVFSLRRSDGTLWFGTPAWDAHWVSQLRAGVEQLKKHGAQVALLQVPCYRPHFTGGPGTFELPERGTDSRTQHVDALLRLVADTDPEVFHLRGPREWCGDERVSTDLRYRYDGVHSTGRGAGLIYSAIAAQLLRIPVSEQQHAKRVRWDR